MMVTQGAKQSNLIVKNVVSYNAIINNTSLSDFLVSDKAAKDAE